MENWFFMEWLSVAGVLFSVALTYLGLIVFVRVNGLRSFAKISGHDFAVTVAIGSILATTAVSKSPAVLQGLCAIAALLVLRSAISYIRIHSKSNFFDNQPLLVMRDGEILEDNLKSANFTRNDLFAKLREANVLNLRQVRAVVVESTGDVSVLHGDIDEYDTAVLRGVGS